MSELAFFWCFISVFLLLFSIWLMFFWENKIAKWWLRLPVLNLLTFVILLICGIIEEIYLTFHPKERTTYIKTSIFQLFF